MSTLIRASWVLTQGSRGDIRDGAVVVDGDVIVAVGSFGDLAAAWPQATVVGDGHGVLLPGFVNAHTHLSEGLLAGMGEQWTLFEWGARTVGPAGMHLTREMADIGTRLKTAEMIRTGVTCVNDMFCHLNVGSMASLGAADALDVIGLRSIVSFGPETLDPTSENESSVALLLDEHRALVERTSSRPLQSAMLALGTIGGASDALMDATVALAGELGIGIHTHLAEVREEVTDSQLKYGCSTLQRAVNRGLFDHRSVAAHVIWLTEADIALLVEHNVSMVHNPVANMILADGVCAVPRLRATGLPMGIGTDGACSNDAQDMLQAIKMTPLIQKLSRNDPRVMTARDAIAMATIDGARALGLDHLIGSIEVGKQADLVRLGGDGPGLAVIHDPYQNVAYSAGPHDVADVWVAGRALLRDGELVDANAFAVHGEARRLASELARTAGLPSVLNDVDV
jgi:5-methylthioadenosine/S-adenosylhomocysteine deaminase